MAKTLALVLMLAAGVAGAQSGEIYRCNQGGQVAYADRPCNGDAVRIGDVAPHGRWVLADVSAPSAWVAQPDAGSPNGLTSREVLARFGRPWETRVQWRNRVLTETWTWSGGSPPRRLTFRDGRVVEP